MPHCPGCFGQYLHHAPIRTIARTRAIIAFALNDPMDQAGRDRVECRIFVDQCAQLRCFIRIKTGLLPADRRGSTPPPTGRQSQKHQTGGATGDFHACCYNRPNPVGNAIQPAPFHSGDSPPCKAWQMLVFGSGRAAAMMPQPARDYRWAPLTRRPATHVALRSVGVARMTIACNRSASDKGTRSVSGKSTRTASN